MILAAVVLGSERPRDASAQAVDTGTIVIVKDRTPDSSDSSDSFTFTEDIPDCAVGPLFDDGTNVGNSVTCSNVPVGTYTVTEDDPGSEYLLTALNCDTTDTSGQDTTEENTGTRTATIDLDANETVTCTFNNLYLNSITVDKICYPENDPGAFAIQILDSGQQPVGGAGVFCGGSYGVGGFDADTYQIVETGGQTTDLADYTVTYGGDCDVNGYVTVGAEDRVTCTVTNTRLPGTIVIVKDTVPNSPMAFNFSATPEILGCTVGPLVDNGGTNSVTCSNAPAGQYDVGEDDPTNDGYALTNLECITSDTSNQDTTSVDIPTRTAHIDLDPGETVTCTFTNEPIPGGTIIIEKDVNPEPDRTNFPFTDTIPGCDIGTLDDDGAAQNPSSTPNSVTCSDIDAGQYQVQESNPLPS